MFSICGYLFVAGISILGFILYDSDKKRRLDQCYKYKLNKKRAEIKLKEAEKLKYRLLAFPASNKIKHIKIFVILEIQKAEEYMMHRNYNKATEHFANGLSLIDYNYKLANILYKNVPLKMYREIIDQMQKIQTMLPKMKI
ncbi:uncharacterized protein LOC132948997 [Metopolophium dirhodum]|uniref:uncharacterized protein LOC132948997 n=1 Tax=Metopolophium dirhodum TaxID=44670 RepID=UPI002990727F|nr:uncharacterized protein LOC132948997 [Metopolophium dirhodum]